MVKRTKQMDSFWKNQSFQFVFLSKLIKKWCVFSEEIGNIVSVNKFRKIIFSFIRPKDNSFFAIHNIKGLKLVTRLRLNFSHLNKQKFRHGFRETVNPMCKPGLETKTTRDFFLRCRLYYTIRKELMDKIYTDVLIYTVLS